VFLPFLISRMTNWSKLQDPETGLQSRTQICGRVLQVPPIDVCRPATAQ